MSEAALAPPPPRRKLNTIFQLNSHRILLIAATLLMLLGFWLFRAEMLSSANLKNILVQTAYLMIFASGHALVLMTRGFDMSLGNTVSLVSVVTALAFSWWGGGSFIAILIALLAGLGTGFAVGAVNGFLVSVVRINPFVVTLGTMNVVATFASTVSGGFPVPNLPRGFVNIAHYSFLGLQIQIWIMVAVALLLHFALTSTVFGRVLLIMGSNPNAARMAGARSRLHLAGAYVACSVIAAFGAILLTARMGSGEPSVGVTLTLETIAAAVVGGISLKGGEGDAFAPLLGALFITVLSNGMNLTGIDGYIQQISLGVIIIISLTLDRSNRSA